MGVKHATSVFETKEFRGEWWLPASPNHKVVGTLKGTETEGFHLTTSGDLVPYESERFFDEFRRFFEQRRDTVHAFVHGETRNGLVTLCDSFQVRRTVRSSGPSELRYYANLVFVGAHFDDAQAMRFQSLAAKANVLCNWVDARVFDHKWDHRSSQLSIQTQFPAKQVLCERAEFAVSLIARPTWRIDQSSLVVEWEPEFLVDSKNDALSWKDNERWNYRRIIGALADLLTVATQVPTFAFDLRLYSDRFQCMPSDKGKAYRSPIALYCQQRLQKSHCERERVIIPWQLIAEDPTTSFANWFEIYPALQVPISLYVDSLRKTNSYSPERFLTMVMALEGLHRFEYPDDSVPSKQHEAKLMAILATAPEAYRRWLCDKLRYSHEPSLRRRLKDLIKPFREIVAWLMDVHGMASSKREACNELIGAIAESRNALAHSLPEPGKDPRQRYHYFTIVAEIVMAMWLMQKIGMSHDQIAARIKKNFYLKQYPKRISAFLKNEF